MKDVELESEEFSGVKCTLAGLVPLIFVLTVRTIGVDRPRVVIERGSWSHEVRNRDDEP